MKTIEISLSRGETKTQLSFILPEKWQEVKPETIIKISPALYGDNENNRIEIIKTFIPRKPLKYFYYLTPEQIHALIQQIDWMYTSFPDTPSIPYFKNDKGTRYHLPAQALKYCNVIEYTFADKYFEQLLTGDPTKIDHIILSLCRPARKDKYPKALWDGDNRERFNPVLIEERIKHIQKVPIQTKMYIILYFIACKKTLAKKYKVLFREREPEEIEKRTTPDFGWISVIWDLAGNIMEEEKVQYTNLHNVLIYLVNQHYKNTELKRNANLHHI